MANHEKTIRIKHADIPNMVDAVFAGVQDDPGWVEMYATAKGRACIDALFPKAHIEWKNDCSPFLPRDWRAFSIHLPSVIDATETLLPLEITGGDDLHEATPDALAFLLAFGVSRQGARSAVSRKDHSYDMFAPPHARN
jgi:hypothetical protein